MGTWGSGLYSDDTTVEVKEEFKNYLESGLTHSQARLEVLKKFDDVLADHQVTCLVYFALADTLWKYGCLDEFTKNYTLALIDTGGDVKYWQEDSPSDAKARVKVLSDLKTRILSPQPPLKTISHKVIKPAKKQITAPIGQVFVLNLPNGDIAILKFVGLRDSSDTLEEAVFRLLPFKGKEIPNKNILESISDKEIIIDDYNEFSFYLPGRRKKLTHFITETDIVIPNKTPINNNRSVCVSISSIGERAQSILSKI